MMLPLLRSGNIDKMRPSHNTGAPMSSNFDQAVKFSLGATSLALCALLSGCGLGPQGTVDHAPVAIAGAHLTGSIHGGQQPISGATVQLYAVGSTGYGSAYPYSSGASLLGSNLVTSDATGSFSITGDYTCPTSTTLVYLVATGGNPGLGSGSPGNPNSALMAALGPCGNLSSSTYLSVNELTTIASVWALSPFMTGIVNIGSSSTNAVGLANAFAKVNKLVNLGSGTTAGTTLPAGGTLPIAKMNTLADILAACINSSGGTAGDSSTSCGTLFTATTVPGITPTDTVTAAMVMAQNPTAQVPALVGLVAPTSPFQPTLSSTPNDLSLIVTYTAGGFSSPSSVAIDNNQNVWVANATTNTVTQMDNTGTALSGSTGFSIGALNAPAALAADQNGYIWVANKGNATVSKIAPGGTGAAVYTVGSAPDSIAVDAYGNAWTSNFSANSLSRINTKGAVLTVNTTGVSAAVGIAIDPK